MPQKARRNDALNLRSIQGFLEIIEAPTLTALHNFTDQVFCVQESVFQMVLNEETEILIGEAPFGDGVIKFEANPKERRSTKFIGDIFVMKIGREVNRFQFAGELR